MQGGGRRLKGSKKEAFRYTHKLSAGRGKETQGKRKEIRLTYNGLTMGGVR